MSDVNQFNCTCGIVTEPELSYVGANKTPLCRCRIGIQDYKDESQYFTLKAWNGLGETLQKYLKVGKKIFLSGRLVLESWETKDGEKRIDAVIYAENFTFLDSGGGNDSKSKNTKDSKNTNNETKTKTSPNLATVSLDSDEDIPF